MREIDNCAAHFKNNPGFNRLMDGMYDLYIRYDRCFGAVRLSRPTPEEEEAISAFFKRDYYNQALIRISLADFERQCQRTFSPDFRLAHFLEVYFIKRFAAKGGQRTNNAFVSYVENTLLPRYIGTKAELWLRDITRFVRRVYRTWSDLYAAEPSDVESMLITVCDVLGVLPVFIDKTDPPAISACVRLSDFSQQNTGDPHTLDASTSCGALFLRALACILEEPVPQLPQERGALYYKAGLLSEGVLACVTLRGLSAAINSEEPETVCDAYNRRGEPHALTLENLNRFTRAQAFNKKAFIVENLSVFSWLNENLRGVNCTIICANGGINPAFTRLLSLLAASGTTLYYSGDLDYAGLSLADRIYLDFPKHFVPWHFGKADYDRIVTETDFFLPESKKDTGLYNEDLAALLSLMRKRGKTALQSALAADLAADIRAMAASDA